MGYHSAIFSNHTHAARFLALFLLPLLFACTPAWQDPIPLEQVDLSHGSKSLSRDGVTVTVAVPSAEETFQLFGTDLYKSRVQPVWVRIENGTEQDLTLMRHAIDDAYVSPAEAAYLRHAGSKERKRAMDVFFQQSEFQNPIASGSIEEGYVFTNLEEGFKNVNIDLLGDELLLNFALVVRIRDSTPMWNTLI